MKISITIFFLSIFTINNYGQDNGLQTKLIDENYENKFQTSDAYDSFYFDLQPIHATKYKTHIRVKMVGQIVDFYSLDNIKFNGLLTNYTSEYITIKNKDNQQSQTKEYQCLIERVILSQTKVDSMVKILFQTGQADIPTDSLIPSWYQHFFDCNNLVFQFYSNGLYTKQTFRCPGGQKDDAAYINIIMGNFKSLKSIFQLDSIYDIFESKLPKGKYYSNDGYRMLYIMSQDQLDLWMKGKPMRDYLKSIKDTVDSYLKAELKKKQVELSTSDCFQSYYLIFGKNGRLKKVMISPNDKPKLIYSYGLADYWSEKRQIKKCEHKIKKIMGACDLAFLKLNYNIYRTISFGINNEAYLRDQTTY